MRALQSVANEKIRRPLTLMPGNLRRRHDRLGEQVFSYLSYNPEEHYDQITEGGVQRTQILVHHGLSGRTYP